MLRPDKKPGDLVERAGLRYVGTNQDRHYMIVNEGGTVRRREPKVRGKAAVKRARRNRDLRRRTLLANSIA